MFLSMALVAFSSFPKTVENRISPVDPTFHQGEDDKQATSERQCWDVLVNDSTPAELETISRFKKIN